MIKDEFFATHRNPRSVSQRDASSRLIDDKSRGFSETKSDSASNARASLAAPEESLIVDDRAALTPAQAVENKLMNLLKDTSMPVSHLQMRGLLRNRSEA